MQLDITKPNSENAPPPPFMQSPLIASPVYGPHLSHYFSLDGGLNDNGLDSGAVNITGPTNSVAGVVGQALRFDGPGSYATFSPTNLSQFTIVGWIKLSEPSSPSTAYVLETNRYRIHNRGANRLQFELRSSTYGRWRTLSSSAFSYEEWVFVAVVVDLSLPFDVASMVRIYKNGLPLTTQVESTPGGTLSSESSGSGVLANNQGRTRPTEGSFDEFGILNRKLSDSEVLEIYENQKPD